MEEEHGMARHAMAVYERATAAVLPEERAEVFNIYIKKVLTELVENSYFFSFKSRFRYFVANSQFFPSDFSLV